MAETQVYQGQSTSSSSSTTLMSEIIYASQGCCKGAVLNVSVFQLSKCKVGCEVMHCAHLKRGPKIFKKGTKRGPDFEQKGDLKGTKRGPKRGPKNRGFKISKKAYMLKFSTKKSNLPSKFIERVHFHFHSPSTIQSNSDKHMYLDTAGYFHTICQMVHKG